MKTGLQVPSSLHFPLAGDLQEHVMEQSVPKYPVSQIHTLLVSHLPFLQFLLQSDEVDGFLNIKYNIVLIIAIEKNILIIEIIVLYDIFNINYFLNFYTLNYYIIKLYYIINDYLYFRTNIKFSVNC